MTAARKTRLAYSSLRQMYPNADTLIPETPTAGLASVDAHAPGLSYELAFSGGAIGTLDPEALNLASRIAAGYLLQRLVRQLDAFGLGKLEKLFWSLARLRLFNQLGGCIFDFHVFPLANLGPYAFAVQRGRYHHT